MLKWNTSDQPQQNHTLIGAGELRNEGMPWNSKLIKKLLLIITMANLKLFILKNKLVIYIRKFVELYNKRNCRQVHEIYGIMELEKMRASIIENSHNLGTDWMIEILLVLHNANIVPRDQDRFVFYINNYIN